MNCSDINLILDDRNIRALDDELRHAIDAHVAGCPDCSRHWTLHARLVARTLPSLPADLLADCTALATTEVTSGSGGRKWNRAALAVGAVVLVAAAATLTFYGSAEHGSSPVGSAPVVSAVPQDQITVANASSSSPSRDIPLLQVAQPSETQHMASAPSQTAGIKTLSVLLSTSLDETLEAIDKPDFDSFRAAVIEELRRTPGVVLVLAESSMPGQTVDHEIMLTVARRNGRLNGILRVVNSGPNRVTQPLLGAFGPDCAPSCFHNAASLGEALAQAAVKRLLPPPTALPPVLVKELQDSSLPLQQRLEALRDLDFRRPMGRTGVRMMDPSGDSLRNPTVVRAAIDLAAAATDPAHRSEIWRTMRSIRNPALLEPLAHAAQLDPDRRVRVEAVTTLVADFAEDPRVRAAFETIVGADTDPMVRALAQRGLSGEAAWNSYVRSSLRNSALSDAQRLEALIFHAQSLDALGQPLARVLDDEAIEALAQVLPSAAEAGTRTLVNRLAPITHPVVTNMLLARIELRDPQFDRVQIMQILAARLSEPEVRAAFEKIAAADPDEPSRRIAIQALQSNE
jgi:hypothetical protein